MSNSFRLTKEHVTLLRKMWVEDGGSNLPSPMIDPKRPYGNSCILEDIVHILKWKNSKSKKLEEGELSQKLLDKAKKIHKEMKTALQVVLSTKSFRPGLYDQTDWYNNTSWKRKNSSATK
jgi:hypothetical protein